MVGTCTPRMSAYYQIGPAKWTALSTRIVSSDEPDHPPSSKVSDTRKPLDSLVARFMSRRTWPENWSVNASKNTRFVMTNKGGCVNCLLIDPNEKLMDAFMAHGTTPEAKELHEA